MNARDLRLYQSFQRRAGTLSPELTRELFRAWEIIRNALSDAELERLIASGQIDAIVDDALLDRSFLPLRVRIVEAVRKGFKSTLFDLPRGGKIDGTIAVAFDSLNPRVVDAIRGLDSRVMNTLSDDLTETVRAFVENGLRDGRSPRSVAKELRQVVGLSSAQAEAVRNYGRALRGENPNAGPLDYQLRDRRYDALIKRGETMTAEQVDRAVAVYARKMEAFNANTVSRTATVDALKLGQKLAWDDAIDQGVVVRADLYMTWIAVAGPGGDGRNRPEHLAMHGETVHFDATFSNGDTVPGESDWNCRCIARYAPRKAA